MDKTMPAVLIAFTIMSAATAFAESGDFGINVFGGIPFHSAQTGVRSNTVAYTDTDFDGLSNIMGASLIRMSKNTRWVGMELSARKFSMDLTVAGENYGKLNLAPITFGLRLQSRPKKAGWGSQFGIGMGLSLNSFDKSRYLTDLENSREDLNFDVSASFVFSAEYGISYYFMESLAVNTNIMWMGNTPYIKNLYGLDDSYMNSQTFQLCFGLTYWI
ncbi:MAG: hypothetical protein A2219_02845 [Elusimicrobia bacterium RIFOXYA2_FULL_50_26]|nr:MAG: hypothetical protein A2219_02845 [Elusimicrobia bacterium RIFOXYA2_FULL_50_26]OGS24690.1 MAG: hypothetical protein A2314_04300 [Elusimicrobia bacterium RIFOXYB2_FULL_50_12]